MSICDNLKLVSYAAAAEAFDKSKNVFFGFLPMVETLLALTTDKLSISFLALQNLINETYQVNIPKVTLRYLLELLEEQGKIRFVDGKTIIPTKQRIAETIEVHNANKDEIENLFSEFQEFLSDRGEVVTISEIREHICKWIYLHSGDLAEFIAAGTTAPSLSESTAEGEWDHSASLLLFLLDCRTSHNSTYNSFLRLFDGAVQASLLNFLPDEIKELSEQKTTVENVILDTNFVLRLLGLQATFDNETARATWKILFDHGTKFYVLEQTILEASQSIKSFLDEISPNLQRVNRYLPNVRVHTTGFFSALKQGVTRTSFYEYSKASRIQEVLQENFSVIHVEEYEDDKILPETEADLIAAKNIDRYGRVQAHHDLLIISYCRKRRPRKINSFKEASWWVLTNDKKLTFWNQRNCGVIQECITEVQLSNIMWLQAKKSNQDGLTNTIMALSAKVATTPAEIVAFAGNVEAYCAENKDKVEMLDNVSLLFASNALTSEEIKKISDDPDAFGPIIEKRASEIKLFQAQQADALSVSNAANEEYSQEIARLNRELKVTKLGNKKKALEDDLSSTKKAISRSNEAQQQLTEIKSEHDKNIAPIGRWMMVIFLFIVVGIFWALKPYLYIPIMGWLENQISAPSVWWNLISIGLFGTILGAVCSVIITLLFGSPMDFKETFNKIRDIWLFQKKKKFILEKKYPVSYIDGDVDILLAQERENVKDAQERLHKIEVLLESIEVEIIKI